MTQLSPHFTLAELTHSDTATLHDIDNTPTPDALLNLSTLATTVLEPARAACGGVALHVHDGYRCAAVNALVGGVPHSQHETGEAADVDAEGLSHRDAFDRIRRDPNIPFDQCILESGCVHLSCAAEGATPRRQVLVRHGTSGHWTYAPPED